MDAVVIGAGLAGLAAAQDGTAYRSTDGMWAVQDGKARPLDVSDIAERVLGRLEQRPQEDQSFRAWLAQLRQPMGDTLFFAGEATAEDGWNGTVDGAIESGRRAARELRASLEPRTIQRA